MGKLWIYMEILEEGDLEIGLNVEKNSPDEKNMEKNVWVNRRSLFGLIKRKIPKRVSYKI